MNRIAIVRSSRLYLSCTPYGDNGRFAFVFRETWRQIPLGDRRRLVAHWRRNLDPLITLAPDETVVADRVSSRAALAVTARKGCELRFAGRIADALPEAHLRTLIAHELGHVLAIAEGGSNAALQIPREEEEEIVREILHFRWQNSAPADVFDEDSLDDWLEGNDLDPDR